MKLFSNLRNKIKSAVTTLTEEDGFDASVAACALVGGADGDWDSQEVNETITSLQNHQAFQPFRDRVSKKVSEFEPLATKHGGRAQLLTIVGKANGKPYAPSIFFTCVDIAEATGGIDEKEQKQLSKIAESLGVQNDPSVQEILNA